MHITDYEKVKDLVANNVFLLDGPNGTQSIFATDLGKAIMRLMPTKDITDNLDLSELAQYGWKRGISADARMPISNENNIIEQVQLRNLLYLLMDSMGSPGRSLNARLGGCGGRNLGNVVTDEQWASIKDGSFTGILLGDYWTIGGYGWTVVDFNYYSYKFADDNGSTGGHPHVVLMATGDLPIVQIHNTNVMPTDGFWGTDVVKNECNGRLLAIAEGAFGADHILSHPQGYFSGPNWAIRKMTKVSLPNMLSYFGHCEIDMNAPDGSSTMTSSEDLTQFSLFARSPSTILGHFKNSWLLDVRFWNNETRETSIMYIGSIGGVYANELIHQHKVFPIIAIYAS